MTMETTSDPRLPPTARWSEVQRAWEAQDCTGDWVTIGESAEAAADYIARHHHEWPWSHLLPADGEYMYLYRSVHDGAYLVSNSPAEHLACRDTIAHVEICHGPLGPWWHTEN